MRRMMRVPWTDKVSNEEVLRKAGVSRKLLKYIWMRQLSFMGHVIRKRGLENLVLTSKIDGKRSRAETTTAAESQFSGMD